jgi:integrase
MTALIDHVDRYLRLRRALGYQLRDHERLLGSFVTFVEDRGTSTLTTADTLDWAAGAASAGELGRRISVVRGFASYLAAFDETTEVPPARIGPSSFVRRTPYLFGDEEVVALREEASKLRPASFAETMTTLIGLLAATGLRPGEAYRLDRGDVDTSSLRLVVRDTKWDRSRLLPLHHTTVEALQSYASTRRSSPGEVAFFFGRSGGRLTSADAAHAFRGLCIAAGVSAPPGRRAPRLYDFRHSFAVAALRDWHRGGLDVEALLPVLSAYLGHLAPANTYWYFEAAPELLEAVTARGASVIGERR